jgi:cyanophycinase
MKFRIYLLFSCIIVFSFSLGCSQNSSPEFGPKNGALVIVGGGIGDEVSIYEKFVDLAGGNDNAKIVIVPNAGGRDSYVDSLVTRSWKKRGVKNVKMLFTKDTLEANTEEFVKDLREATGVWFNGGRQWRIVDAYLNTLTYDEFHKVLERGGVIGGSSAGATIQGSFLARGAESGNTIMIAPNPKHLIGFSFLKNSAIDQHIDRRNRWNDLREIILEYPKLLGIGLSEATAIIVKGDQFEVMGRGKVAIHDANKMFTYQDSTHYYALNPGDKFDIKTRSIIYRASSDSVAVEN